LGFVSNLREASIAAMSRLPSKQIMLMDITALPDAALNCVASFFPVIEKALFSIAFVHQRHIIIGNDVQEEIEHIDFMDIDENLASRLTDVELSNILQGIDAVNITKTLKLTNCSLIRGRGLEPLRGSTKLQLIDLSLLKHNSCVPCGPHTSFSAEEVIPILDSIIDRGQESTLKCIQYPYYWIDDDDNELVLAFHDRFRRHLLEQHQHICMYCPAHAMNSKSCYVCLKVVIYCDGCHNEPDIHGCYNCDKNHCLECVDLNLCQDCYGEFCSGCSVTCEECGLWSCNSCISDHFC
jgi:hypothetical protein